MITFFKGSNPRKYVQTGILPPTANRIAYADENSTDKSSSKESESNSVIDATDKRLPGSSKIYLKLNFVFILNI